MYVRPGVQPYPMSSTDVFNAAVSWGLLFIFFRVIFKWTMTTMAEVTNLKTKGARKIVTNLLKKIGYAHVKLTRYEIQIASNLIDPAEIAVSWESIAGLDDVIKELRETVIFPMQNPNLITDSKLIQPPSGVLLHGPPGCGKTMLAKAMAKEAGACFLNIDVATLGNKWYGESQKLANAVFTLGAKLQPTIIFIDEIESFLRPRSLRDNEVTAMMKAQFLSLWDGLTTDKKSTIVVLGATNRPGDVDKAILRRMPCTFHIGLPNEEQRRNIIQLMLQDEPITEDVDVSSLAKLTEGFSGSDLKELCRTAAFYRIGDYIKVENQKKEGKEAKEKQKKIRKMLEESSNTVQSSIEDQTSGQNDHLQDRTSTTSNDSDVGQGDALPDPTNTIHLTDSFQDHHPVQTTNLKEQVPQTSGLQRLRLMAMADFKAALLKMQSSKLKISSGEKSSDLWALSSSQEVLIENCMSASGAV